MESFVDKTKLPKDVVLGASLLHVTGHYGLIIENYKCIVEYTDKLLIVKTKHGRISIEGENLDIEYYTNEDMKIKGKLKNICFF